MVTTVFLTECKDHRETEVQLQAIPFLGKRVVKLFSVVQCKRCATLEAELEFPQPSTPHVDFLSQEGFRRKIKPSIRTYLQASLK